MRNEIEKIIEDYRCCTDSCEKCAAFKNLTDDYRDGNYCNLLSEYKEMVIESLRKAVVNL